MDSEETIIKPIPVEETVRAPVPPEVAKEPEAPPPGEPKRLLSVADGAFLTIGMIIGVGIFEAPARVAGNSSSTWEFLALWLVGGIVSLCGALVYAELSARHPETGGEYAFLSRAFGKPTGFVFAWCRIVVIQTGAIAGVAFVFGAYATQIYSLGSSSTLIYAAISVVALTALNVAGTLPSKGMQRFMETILIAGLLMLAVAGLMAEGGVKPSPPAFTDGAIGFALMFVFFTYGGWNEAAYLSGEVRDAPKNMVRVLLLGIGSVTLLYLLVNIGYLAALGLQGIRESKAVAVDVMRLVAGDSGALVIALIVCISAATTINAAIFTGARTTWAFGRDFPAFARLGHWQETGSTPANALLLQGIVSLALVLVGGTTPDGFGAMVAYTAPVFWTFFLLTGITLFLFRMKEAGVPEFMVPAYPFVPFVFCAMCVYMLFRSIDYIFNPVYGPKFGMVVLAGLAVMAAGIPLYFLTTKK